jgi:hypothetical protein
MVVCSSIFDKEKESKHIKPKGTSIISMPTGWPYCTFGSDVRDGLLEPL